MKKVLIKNAKIVNEGTIFTGDVYIEGDTIMEIADTISAKNGETHIIDAEGQFLLPGVIDDQVHLENQD